MANLEAITITIVGARKLVPKDDNGFSDPYAIVECGKSKFRTKTIYKTLNPTWDESFNGEIPPYTPIVIEVWDRDELSVDDFEGECKINWWTISELMSCGEAEKSFPLERGTTILKNCEVGGEVIVNLKLRRFTEMSKERGELGKLFPDMPDNENVLSKINCSIGKVSGDTSLDKVNTHHGTVYLLNHYIYTCVESKSGNNLKTDFPYDMIRSVEPYKKKNKALVITLTGGTKYIFSKLGNADKVIKIIQAQISNCTLNDEKACMIQLLSSDEGVTANRDEPCTIVLKVYIPDHKTLGCNNEYVLTCDTGLTFKALAEKLFDMAGITKDSSKYRFVPAIPAYRTELKVPEKLTSKYKISYALSKKMIGFGTPLILKLYDKKIKSKLFRRSGHPESKPIPTVRITLILHYNYTKQSDPEEMEIPSDISLDESIIGPVCSKRGIDSEKVKLYRRSLNSDPSGTHALVELSKDDTAEDVFMIDEDVLIMKLSTPFTTLVEKFGKHGENLAAYSLLCHCFFNPIHPRGKDDSLLTKAVTRLKLPSKEAQRIENAAGDHAKYGPDAILVELIDRLRTSKMNTFYTRKSFKNDLQYNKWLVEQREAVLSLMRTTIFDNFPFCGELHVRVIRGSHIVSLSSSSSSSPPVDSDSDKTSGGSKGDPYCTAILRTQRQSTDYKSFTSNPEWDEEMVFTMTSVNTPLIFHVNSLDLTRRSNYVGGYELNWREHLECLDGKPHDLELPLKSANGTPNGGRIFISVQCFFHCSDYLQLAEKIPLDDMPTSGSFTFAYFRYYQLLCDALDETHSREPERSWVLREFNSRFGISDTYCDTLKLKALLELDMARLTPQTSVATSECVVRVVRPTTTLNDTEIQACEESAQAFVTRAGKVFLPAAMSAGEPGTALATPLIKALVDVLEWNPSYGVLENIVCDAIHAGGLAQFGKVNREMDWSDAAHVLKAYPKSVRKAYRDVFTSALAQVRTVTPPHMMDVAIATLVSALDESFSRELSKVCESIADSDTPLYGSLFECIKDVSDFRKFVAESASCPMRTAHYMGLIIIWEKLSRQVLLEWASRAQQIDSRKPVASDAFHSSSVVDVADSCRQVILQLNQITIDDPFVWSQASELLISVITFYFMQEAKGATATVQGIKEAGIEIPNLHDALRDMSLSLSNIERAQETLDEVVECVEEGLTVWKTENKDAEEGVEEEESKYLIAKQSVRSGIAQAIKKSNEYIVSPLHELGNMSAEIVVNAFASNITDIEGAFDVAEKTYEKMLDFSDYVSTRVFRLALTEYWMAFLDKLWQTIKPGVTTHNFTSRKTSNCHLTFIEKMLGYFENGVNKRKLKECPGYIRVQQLLTLYKLPSTELIGIYNTLLTTSQVAGLLPPQQLDVKRFEGFETELLSIILRERSDKGDVWAQPFFKQGLSVEESNRIRCLFKYPPTELFLNRWRCSHAKVAGWLFLSSKYISFCSEEVNVNIPLLNVTSIEIDGFITFFKDIRVEFNVTESSDPKPSPPLPKSPEANSFKMPVVAKKADDDEEEEEEECGSDDVNEVDDVSNNKKGKKSKKKGKHRHSGRRSRSNSTNGGKKGGKSGSSSKSSRKRASVNMSKRKRASVKYDDDDYENESDEEDKNEFAVTDYEDDNVLGGEEKKDVGSATIVEKKVLTFGKFLSSMDEIVRLIIIEAKMIGNKNIKSN